MFIIGIISKSDERPNLQNHVDLIFHQRLISETLQTFKNSDILILVKFTHLKWLECPLNCLPSLENVLNGWNVEHFEIYISQMDRMTF